ncbi:MAG: histidinol-phosphate transaminase [Saprospiraceae bacterium]|nr:histidinol-phosphate transaminase [Saprospiraceae bacterium]
MNLKKLVRPNIWELTPYSSARHEFEGQADVLLDANENPMETGLNRYPDPLQRSLKALIAKEKKVEEDSIFLGNGSDEAIDILMRIFCRPGEDAIMTFPPTYGMYQVSADIADVAVLSCPLSEDFQPVIERVEERLTSNTKMLFICSPNNPTGNLISNPAIEGLLQRFEGIIVIDEAYIDFSSSESWTNRLSAFPRLVVLQTFSKAWGLAGIRLGMAFAHPNIIRLMNAVKPPYNVNQLTQRRAIEVLRDHSEQTKEVIALLVKERQRLTTSLKALASVVKIYPSDANFLLVRFKDHQMVFDALKQQGVIVRDRSNALGCRDCLRITVGTPAENDLVVKIIKALT